MRRIWASLLLTISALSLIAPAVTAVEAQSTLPACCRRNGRHHCSIRDRQAPDGGIRLQSARCPLFPARDSVPAAGFWFVGPGRAAMVVAAALTDSAARPRTETLYRISCSRVRLKRGPPSLS